MIQSPNGDEKWLAWVFLLLGDFHISNSTSGLERFIGRL
jgi:hypothetical protein